MIADELRCRILAAFGFLPTEEQEHAISVCIGFVTSPDTRSVMLLRGCAGTGKTLLASAIVRTLAEIGQSTVLLAPTGRAAKVFALNSGQTAHTIHRHIYRQQQLTADMSGFQLGYNRAKRCLFVVDEASMVSNTYGGDNFGSGRLLDDLVRFVYSGAGCRLMLIGDHAQLPPVGENNSPALQREELEHYGLTVHEATLDTVMRQSQLSGILWNASHIRQLAGRDTHNLMPKVRLKGFADIHYVSGEELIDTLANSLQRVGEDEMIVITRSNRRANIINNGIRHHVFDREEELEGGDIVMTVRNNYYWLKPHSDEQQTTKQPNDRTTKQPNDRTTMDIGIEVPDFIANGDRAIVRRLRNHRQLYGFHFADATLRFPDYDNMELTATLLLDTLHSDTPALDAESNQRLYSAVSEDYQHLHTKAERIKAIKQDAYYNALQVKYAYAVTCHKAQGGQWAHVYVDQGFITADSIGDEHIHWLYTAFTRASEHLFLINWPTEMTEQE